MKNRLRKMQIRNDLVKFHDITINFTIDTVVKNKMAARVVRAGLIDGKIQYRVTTGSGSYYFTEADITSLIDTAVSSGDVVTYFADTTTLTENVTIDAFGDFCW